MTGFVIDPRLANDSILLARGPLSQLRLMKAAVCTWFLLVPEVNEISEITQLSESEQFNLWKESQALSEWLLHTYPQCKLNIAAIGNVVSQLHVHHVVRYSDDPFWPAPIWGQKMERQHSIRDIEAIQKELSACSKFISVEADR